MNALRTLFLLSLSGLLAACVSGGQVVADSDPHADFSRYHTFAFSDQLGTNRGGADTLLSQRLKSAAAREMQARGFVYQPQSPDLLLDFHAKTEERTYTSNMFTPMIGYAYYSRRGFYTTWPMWNYNSINDTYAEGKLNIDLIDAVQKRVVWETVVYGQAARATGPKATGIVDVAMAKAFRRFPVSPPLAPVENR